MKKTYLKSLALAGYRSYNSDLMQNKIELNDINIIIGEKQPDFLIYSYMNLKRFCFLT